ncbi:MAG: glycosyltransferase family 8 protein [Thermoleophilaceae bacterium]|nr:glycosyltransferase family 8 protein [Thermoleophilaceae bacterium]
MAVHLACAARRDYVPHCAAMLDSALGRHAPGEVHVHFLHGADLHRPTRRALARMIEDRGGFVSFLKVSRLRARGLLTRSGLPASHWYRVFLPELLPDIDRLVYLDADTIVLEPLQPLAGIDLQGNLLAAVTNVFLPEFAHRPHQLGLAAGSPYFNSGVMVMDLAAMRRADATREVLAWARASNDPLVWPEQDALNVVLGSRRMALHPRWNCMNSILLFREAEALFSAEELAEARERPAIRHFEGPARNKPWHPACERRDRELYLTHRRRTPWPRVASLPQSVGAS